MTRRDSLQKGFQPQIHGGPWVAPSSLAFLCPALNFLGLSWIWIGFSGDVSGMWRAWLPLQACGGGLQAGN